MLAQMGHTKGAGLRQMRVSGVKLVDHVTLHAIMAKGKKRMHRGKKVDGTGRMLRRFR